MEKYFADSCETWNNVGPFNSASASKHFYNQI